MQMISRTESDPEPEEGWRDFFLSNMNSWDCFLIPLLPVVSQSVKLTSSLKHLDS